VLGTQLGLIGNLSAATITIDGSQTNQVIDGFGVNANHRSWNNDELQPVLNALIDQGGMTIFRVIFDSADWESTNDNDDPDVMNWDYYNTNYSSLDFEKLWSMIGYLNQRGITDGIMLNFQGPGPDWMGGSSLTPGYEDEWAERIVSLLLYARTNRHLQFHLVGPNNEPDKPPQGIAVTDANQYVLCLHELAQKLDAYGLGDIRIIGPDLAFGNTAFMPEMTNDPVVMAKLAHFSVHSYAANGNGSENVYDFINQSPYPDRSFWVTEFNVWCAPCEDSEYGTYDWTYCRGTAEYLLGHLGLGASGAMVWEAYDSYYTNIGSPYWSFWGIFGVDDTNAEPLTYTARKDFYTLAQITKFVRPGAQMIGVSDPTDPFEVLAFRHPVTGQFTITGVNTNSDTATLTATLVSMPPISSLELYYTDAHTNLCHSATLTINNNAFTTTIPADCVFTLSNFDPSQFGVSVQITNPVNGAQFNGPANIPIQAAASTVAGSINQVEFFSGTNDLGGSRSPPYGITWSNVPPGQYMVTAQARNSFGGVAVSSGVQVSVAGPVAQIAVAPENLTIAPYDVAQFTAIGADALGSALNPQPAFAWSVSGGGAINSNGLFYSSGALGGFTVLATNGNIGGAAMVTVSTNLNVALNGIGYIWYSMLTANDDAPQIAAPGINDGDTNTDVVLNPGGPWDSHGAYEAAGVEWATPQTINRVLYVNGSYVPTEDGVFAAAFALQFSPDGLTWTNSDATWSFSPPYTYNSPASAGVAFTFAGGPATIMGVRCVGQVRTSEISPPPNSWYATATEVQAFGNIATAQPTLTATLTTNGLALSWYSSATNYVLEKTTNFFPPADWGAVTNVTQSINNQQTIFLTPTSQQLFFRLQRQ
jgi:O-glycosyl hydrolase